MPALSATHQAVYNAILLRTVENGYSLSPTDIWALVTDIIQVINTNAGTVVADSASDSGKFKPPPHT